MTKADLLKISELKIEIRDAEEYLNYLNDLIKNLVPKNDGMPKGSGVTDKVGNLTSSKIDTENHIQKLREELRTRSIELAAEISNLPIKENRKQILMLHYIDGLKLAEIHKRMHYGYIWVKQMHRDVLKEILDDYKAAE